MKPTSPLQRALQILAVVQAVLIVIMAVVWWRAERVIAPASADAEQTRPAEASPTSAPPIPVASERPATAADPTAARSPTADSAVQSARAALYGMATGVGGEPLRDGVLWLYRDGKHVGTASGDLAPFVFSGLSPGLHRLRSRVADQLPIDRDVEVHAPATRLDFEFPARWVLSVKAVTPEGKPWRDSLGSLGLRMINRGLVALAFDSPLNGDLPASNQGEVEGGLGPFRPGHDPFDRSATPLPKDVLGLLTLPPGQPVHVALILRQSVIAQQLVAADQPEVTFTLPIEALQAKLARVRVRVVDPQGLPVAKANVACNDGQTGGGGKPTDEEGRVVLENLVPGRLDLMIRSRLANGPPVQILVPPGADLDLGDVVLPPPTPVEMQIANLTGSGSLRIHLLDPLRPDWTAGQMHFSIEGAGVRKYDFFPGRYAVLATGAEGVAMTVIDLRTVPPGPLGFELRRGAELRIETNFGAVMAEYELASADGVIVRRREVRSAASEVVELPPGRYAVRITDQSGTVTRREFELPAGGMTMRLP